MQNRFVAVLSSPVLVVDGTYSIETIIEIPDLEGVEHYIGHLSTRLIVEKKGAIKASTNIFKGLEVNQSAICFTLKKGFGSREKEGITVNQEVSIEDLQVRILTRLK